MRPLPYVTIAALALLAALPATAPAAQNGTCQNGQGSGGYDHGRPDPCKPVECVQRKRKPKPCKPSGTRSKLVISATVATLPEKYQRGYQRQQIAYCGFLRIRDENRDGMPEALFVWSGLGIRPGTAAGHWDGSKIVPDRPIPRIAAIATRGAYLGTAAKFDRQVCGAPSPEMRRLTISDSMNGMRVEYRTVQQRRDFPLLAALDAQAWAATAAAFQKTIDDDNAARLLAVQQAAAAHAVALAAQWQAKVDAWKAVCIPGSSVRVQHGATVEVWVC